LPKVKDTLICIRRVRRRSEEGVRGTDETPAASQLVRRPVPVKPWDLWDRPFTYRTDQLHTFVLFLTDPAAKEWEIHHMSASSMTLGLTDAHSELLYTVQVGELAAEEAARLCGMLERLPPEMPNPSKEKLAGYVKQFLRRRYYEL
jgi:hypothetical protein